MIPAISSQCRGRALAGWHMEEDAVLKLHSRELAVRAMSKVCHTHMWHHCSRLVIAVFGVCIPKHDAHIFIHEAR